MDDLHDVDLAAGERLYRMMLRIRGFELAAARLLAANELDGFLHLSVGQEGAAAGVCDVLKPTDLITSTHRGHGHCLAKGGTLERMMAELFGCEDGYCRGRAGSLHIADPEIGILGANAIVGGGIPMAVGAALAARNRESGQVVVAFFGEGAVAEGVFHECCNLAALWKLPIMFACEHNGFAEMTPSSVHLVADSVTAYAEPHGIAAESVDARDVLEVRRVASRMLEEVRAGEGPQLLELRTQRWRGHFEGDPQSYREPAALAALEEHDPIQRLRELLTSVAPELTDALDEAERVTRNDIDAAIEHGRSGMKTPLEAITEDVYRTGVLGDRS